MAARSRYRRNHSGRLKTANLWFNCIVLLLCLVAILIFKNIMGDQAAHFMDQYASEPDASAVESDQQALKLSIEVASHLVHQARNNASGHSFR